VKKKMIWIGILCAAVLWIAAATVDFLMVKHGRFPLFCIGTELADDGGSGDYVGLGYSFVIKGNFMPEDLPFGITSYRGYLFGIEVVSLEEAIPDHGFEERDTLVKSPPALTVRCGEEQIEALMGTTSWTYRNADGTGQGFQADSSHPLESKAYMTPLVLSSVGESAIAFLHWDPLPDKVTIRCFDGDSFGQYDAEGETIPVSANQIELKTGAFVYEVIAEWNLSHTWGGTVHYGFYTVTGSDT